MGCGGALPHPPYSAQATIALIPIATSPPPGRVETIPAKPPQADAWVDGEWLWRHERWCWLLGRWVKTPPGAAYSPWVVVRSIDGAPWYAPSVWRDENGAIIDPPQPLAQATASGETVLDPEGAPEDTGRNIKTAPPARRKKENVPPPTE
jgi:hypothetical protein